LKDYRALLDKYGYRCALYGHLGQGCIHCRVDLSSPEGGRYWHAFLDEATDLVVRYNGSLSARRSEGAARDDLLPRLYGDTLVQAFREFKAIWDPRNRMNPGWVADRFPYAEPPNLRRVM
jgi:FAD/FMN-containing dehydrogenase